MLFALLLIFSNFYIVSINEFLFYVFGRTIYIFVSNFLLSYFRLKDKPIYALVFTLSINSLTLLMLLIYYYLGAKIDLFIVFIPQVIASLFIGVYNLIVMLRLHKFNVNLFKYLKSSLFYSWPTITQVFIMMYLDN